MTDTVTKDEAVRRLRAAGLNQSADQLDEWRDSNGNSWGWDGFVRGAYPDLVATIWPSETDVTPPLEARGGIFARNHLTYLEYAVKESEVDSRRLVTFRSSVTWKSGRKLLDAAGEVPVFFAVVDEGPPVQFKASLREIVLAPRKGDPATDRLIQATPPETESEELWDGKVATLYAISGCYRLPTPFPMTRLVKLSNGEPIAENFGYSYVPVLLPDDAVGSSLMANDMAEPPARIEARISRIIRNTAIVRLLKRVYDDRCQRCSVRLELNDGSGYSEGHHLKPLGREHSGPDIKENILILCPNCHALLDLGAVRIDLEQLRRSA